MTDVSEFARHRRTLHRALEIFEERSAVRGDLWANVDPQRLIDMIEEKHRRVNAAMGIMRRAEDEGRQPQLLEVAVDDLLDIINFAVFAVRHIEGDLPDTSGQKDVPA